MKKLTLIFILISFNILAQRVDEFTTSSGYVVREGSLIKVIKGSKGEGGFKYVKLSKRSVMAGISLLGMEQEEQKEFNSFPEQQLGFKFELKKIVALGNQSKGFHYIGYFKAGMLSYQVDLQYAFDAKEIEFVSNIEINYAPKEVTIVKQNIDSPNKKLVQENVQPKIEAKPAVEIVEPKPKETTKVIEQQMPIDTSIKTPDSKTEPLLNTTTFSPEVAKLVQLLTEQLTKELTIKISKELKDKLIKELKQ